MLRAAVRSAIDQRCRVDFETKLGRDHHAVAVRLQRLSNHPFILEWAVRFRSVEEGHTAFNGIADELDAVSFRKGGAIGLGNAHAAEADRGDRQTTGPKITCL